MGSAHIFDPVVHLLEQGHLAVLEMQPDHLLEPSLWVLQHVEHRKLDRGLANHGVVLCRRVVIFNAKLIIFNAKFFMFNAKFIVSLSENVPKGGGSGSGLRASLTRCQRFTLWCAHLALEARLVEKRLRDKDQGLDRDQNLQE